MAEFSFLTLDNKFLGRGFVSGRRHRVTMQLGHRGGETRSIAWGKHVRSFSFRQAMAKADVDELRAFMLLLGGAEKSFYIEDPLGKSSASDHLAAPSENDVYLGMGDGSTTRFRAVMRFATTTEAEQSRYEVAANVFGISDVRIALDGQSIPQAGNWNFDEHEGTIDFVSAPGQGVVVTGGFRYKARVRMDLSDDWLAELAIGFDVGAVDLEAVEEKRPIAVPDRMGFGGSAAVALGGKTHAFITPQDGFFIFYTMTNDATLYLPDLRGTASRTSSEGKLGVTVGYGDSLPLGGPHFCLFNADTNNTLTLKEKVHKPAGLYPEFRSIQHGATIGPLTAKYLFVAEAAASTDPDGLTGPVWVAQ